MNSRKVTLAGLVLILLVAAGIEVNSLVNPAQGDTISEIVWGLSAASPLFTFVCGILAGHFWFPKGACVHCGKRPWAKDPAPAPWAPGRPPVLFCEHCGTVADHKHTNCRQCGAPL